MYRNAEFGAMFTLRCVAAVLLYLHLHSASSSSGFDIGTILERLASAHTAVPRYCSVQLY